MNTSLKVFTEQVALQQQFTSLFYILSTLGVFIGIIAISLIDAGISSRKNLFDTIIQKIVCSFVSALSFLVVGYAIWNYQYYQAFSVPSPFISTIKDWWFAGANMQTFSQYIDPQGTPEADTFQIFSVFFMCFAGLTAALIHGAGLERIKPSANYVMSAFIGGIMVPTMSYLTYGSTSPLTNTGLHDFVGAYCLYMMVGGWALILTWKLGPRKIKIKTPGEPALLILGFFLLMLAIPMFVIGCGFITPGSGYFGPTMTTSGLGLIFISVFVSMGGGAIGGSIIAYRKRKVIYVLAGPVAGYLSCSSLYDIVTPGYALIISFFGPFIMYAGEIIMEKSGLDDPKVVPLALGPSIYSVLMAGIIGSGIHQGGYAGLTDGDYRFQHAEISILTQLEGVVIVLAITCLSALIVTFLVQKLIGLRISDECEEMGADNYYWFREKTEKSVNMTPELSAESEIK